MKTRNCPIEISLFSAVLFLASADLSLSPAQPRPAHVGPVMDFPPGMPDLSGGNSGGKQDSSSKEGGGPWVPSEPIQSGPENTNDLIQVSFQGANVDMVVQWLAQTTGKTVVKHPQVQCQLTITSSKKVSTREAINIVYRALALEGYTVVESAKSILLVPEGKEPRMSPEVIGSEQKVIPEGRRRFTKVFDLRHVTAVELQEKVRPALSDKANIILGGPYQMVITDYNDNLRVAGELIDALDSERPQDVAVRVIALKNIGAQDLAKELAPLYQKMGAKSPQEAIDVAADDRANALMVFSSEASFNALQQIIALLDTDSAQEKVMETFALKNADAQDVAKQLQDLGQNQSISARYFFYQGSGSDVNSKKMTVVADRRRNAVVVQAPPAQMEGIRKMVDQLDEPISDDSLAPRIFRLKYVSAVDIEDVLNELFLKKQQQRSYWDYFSDDAPQASADRDVGRLYGKVRITSEPYANAIIVTSNSKENLAVVEDVLRQLDAPSEAGESTLRLGLKYSKAATVANSLNILFAKNGSPPLRPSSQQNQANNANNTQQTQNQQGTPSSATTGFELQEQTKEEGYYPWLGGQPDVTRNGDTRSTTRPVSDLVGRVRAVADERSNALLLSANVHFFPQILKLISDLDVPTDQVLIDARILEVSSDYLKRLGVRWSPDGSQVFSGEDYDNSFLTSINGGYQKGFGGNTTVNGNTINGGASSLLQSLTTLRSGVLGGNFSLDFLVQFLHETTDASVLGDPQITIADNDTARLFVGQRVPTITGVVNPSIGGSSQNFVYQDVGVILEVNPHINKEGDVELKIHVESSSVVPGQAILNVPFIAANTFHTDLRAKNGQTLVVGGIIQKTVNDTLRKTPLLGDVPGLGWLFKKRDKETQTVELMVFLKPRVLSNTADARDLMEDINKNHPRLQQWEKESEPGAPRGKS